MRAQSVEFGSILSIRPVNIRPDSTMVGTGTGAVLGGLAGSQIGGGTAANAAGAVAGAFGHAFSMPEPDWDIALMLATPALGYLGFRTLDGFARYSKSSKHKVMVGK